jgi:hypothetical protein
MCVYNGPSSCYTSAAWPPRLSGPAFKHEAC